MKNKILKLVNSLEFQELKSYCGEKITINALNEYRHNDFIAWWLNPKSGHGLGDAPLKLFLRLAATKSLGEATFGIEGFDGSFYNRVLAGSYNVNLLEDIEVEKNGIDIWTVLELSYEEDGNVVRRIIPVVIENKACSNDLTARYLNAVTSYPGVENVELAPMAILLTEEPTQPQCNQFDNITYHELLTYVVEPLVANDVLQHVADNNREVFDTAFASLYSPSAVKEIIDQNSKVLETTDEEINLLRMLWDANEAVFEAALHHLYKERQATLDKLFKSSIKEDGRYIVSHNGNAIFPGKCLSKAMTACAIFKAYLAEYPATTLNELQKAFPCEELNGYYYERYYNDLFYESNPDNIDCSGEHVLSRDFYHDDEQLLPIENGTKKAACVKIWRKGDFGRLIDYVHAKGYDKFISIEEC